MTERTTDEIVAEARAKEMLERMTIDAQGPFQDPHHADEWKRTANGWHVIITFDDPVTTPPRRHTFRTEYWMGSGHVEYKPGRTPRGEWTGVKWSHYGPGQDAVTKPRPPALLGVLSNLASDCTLGDQSFEWFCADLGYDTDSRSAYKSWEACREEMYQLRELFGSHYDTFTDTEWEEIQ